MNKTVKAVLCLIFVIGMICTLAACGNDIAGRYELVSMESNGQTLDIASLKDLSGSDVDMYLELFDDGTAVMKMDGDTTQLKWDSEHIWPVNNEAETAVYTIADDTITMVKDGVTLIFKK